uniref:Uncharacterized protein n=1 Tax=viral metagenome TaxID=1070528 RepID=A0A6H1ZFR6_9ZZZZ
MKPTPDIKTDNESVREGFELARDVSFRYIVLQILHEFYKQEQSR